MYYPDDGQKKNYCINKHFFVLVAPNISDSPIYTDYAQIQLNMHEKHYKEVTQRCVL